MGRVAPSVIAREQLQELLTGGMGRGSNIVSALVETVTRLVVQELLEGESSTRYSVERATPRFIAWAPGAAPGRDRRDNARHVQSELGRDHRRAAPDLGRREASSVGGGLHDWGEGHRPRARRATSCLVVPAPLVPAVPVPVVVLAVVAVMVMVVVVVAVLAVHAGSEDVRD